MPGKLVCNLGVSQAVETCGYSVSRYNNTPFFFSCLEGRRASMGHCRILSQVASLI